MIRVTGKPIATSKKVRIFTQAAAKSARANKSILIAVQEEQKRQSRGLNYSQLRVVK